MPWSGRDHAAADAPRRAFRWDRASRRTKNTPSQHRGRRSYRPISRPNTVASRAANLPRHARPQTERSPAVAENRAAAAHHVLPGLRGRMSARLAVQLLRLLDAQLPMVYVGPGSAAPGTAHRQSARPSERSVGRGRVSLLRSETLSDHGAEPVRATPAAQPRAWPESRRPTTVLSSRPSTASTSTSDPASSLRCSGPVAAPSRRPCGSSPGSRSPRPCRHERPRGQTGIDAEQRATATGGSGAGHRHRPDIAIAFSTNPDEAPSVLRATSDAEFLCLKLPTF